MGDFTLFLLNRKKHMKLMRFIQVFRHFPTWWPTLKCYMKTPVHYVANRCKIQF